VAQTVCGRDLIESCLEVMGCSHNAGYDLERGEVEVGMTVPPLLDDVVYTIVQLHGPLCCATE
jgi:hypothetical protein